jgi:hypothetical protein
MCQLLAHFCSVSSALRPPKFIAPQVPILSAERRGDKWLALAELLAGFDAQHPQPKHIPVLRLSDIA